MVACFSAQCLGDFSWITDIAERETDDEEVEDDEDK